jgi:hypothetical protein
MVHTEKGRVTPADSDDGFSNHPIAILKMVDLQNSSSSFFIGIECPVSAPMKGHVHSALLSFSEINN